MRIFYCSILLFEWKQNLPEAKSLYFGNSRSTYRQKSIHLFYLPPTSLDFCLPPFSKFLVMFSILPIKEDQRNREAQDIKYPRQVAIFGNKSTMYKSTVWLSTRTLYFRVVSNLIASRKGDDVQTMVKLSKLLVVNVCIFILFLIQAVTGGWIWIDILSGARPPLVLLRLHPYTGIVLTVFILLHIYLNWRWVKVQLLNQKL